MGRRPLLVFSLIVALLAFSATSCLLIDDFSDVHSDGEGGQGVTTGSSSVNGSVHTSAKSGTAVSSTSTGPSGECLGAPNQTCELGEACGLCEDCGTADCDKSACIDNGQCSDDPLCICDDCLTAGFCSCNGDGICNYKYESCGCDDCAGDPACP